MIGSWYAYAAASDPDKVPYDLSFWRTQASVAGTALSVWLSHRRSPAALPTAAATSVATLALGALNKKKTGSYVTRSWRRTSWKEKAFNRLMPVAHGVGSVALAGLGAWATLSGRTRLDAPSTGPLIDAPWYPLARKLGLYFMSFSMLGHWVEILFCLGIKHGIFKGGYDRSNHMLWDQWLFPFPAEGTAAVLADRVLVPVKREICNAVAGMPIPAPMKTPVAIAASFLANQAVCTAVDFGCGMVANRNYELWDYRDMRFHFMGQVCLQNSLFYSTVATWGVWWLLPRLDELLKRAGDVKLDGVLVGFGAVFLFLELLYQVLPFDKDDEDN